MKVIFVVLCVLCVFIKSVTAFYYDRTDNKKFLIACFILAFAASTNFIAAVLVWNN